MNATFKEALNLDEDLQKRSGRMFYVWDGNQPATNLDALYF